MSKIPCWGGRDRERMLLLTRPKSEGTQTHGQDRPELVRTLPSTTPTYVWSEASGDRHGIPRQYEPVRLGSWVSDFRLILNGGEPYAEVKPVNDFPLDVAQGELGARCTGEVLILGRERRHARRYRDNGWTPVFDVNHFCRSVNVTHLARRCWIDDRPTSRIVEAKTYGTYGRKDATAGDGHGRDERVIWTQVAVWPFR